MVINKMLDKMEPKEKRLLQGVVLNLIGTIIMAYILFPLFYMMGLPFTLGTVRMINYWILGIAFILTGTFTLKPRKTVITLSLIAILIFSMAGSTIFMFLMLLKYFISPLAIFIAILFFVCSILLTFFGLIFILLIIRLVKTHLYIYEKGIEILHPTIIPSKFKRQYIPFEDIKKVEIKETNVQINTLYIHIEDREAYELDEFDILDLEEAKNLIIKYIEDN